MRRRKALIHAWDGRWWRLPVLDTFAQRFGLTRRRSLTLFRGDEATPAADPVPTKRKLTEICVFARSLAELAAPPTMRDHAETSSAMIADLALSHHTLARHLNW